MNDYKPWEKLKKMFPTNPGHYSFSDNDAISMMVLTRELLEKSKKADKFTVLNLFCNWTVHTELEGSKAAYKILSRVTDIFLSSDDLVKREHLISKELSLAQLRQEIIRLYTIYGIPTHIFKAAATWKMFGQHFFKAVLGKRLRYPPNPSLHSRASSIYNEVISKAGSRLDRVALTLRLQTGFPEMDTRIYWIVECLDGHEERGEYKNLESDPDFSNPSFWEGKVAFVKAPRAKSW